MRHGEGGVDQRRSLDPEPGEEPVLAERAGDGHRVVAPTGSEEPADQLPVVAHLDVEHGDRVPLSGRAQVRHQLDGERPVPRLESFLERRGLAVARRDLGGVARLDDVQVKGRRVAPCGPHQRRLHEVTEAGDDRRGQVTEVHDVLGGPQGERTAEGAEPAEDGDVGGVGALDDPVERGAQGRATRSRRRDRAGAGDRRARARPRRTGSTLASRAHSSMPSGRPPTLRTTRATSTVLSPGPTPVSCSSSCTAGDDSISHAPASSAGTGSGANRITRSPSRPSGTRDVTTKRDSGARTDEPGDEAGRPRRRRARRCRGRAGAGSACRTSAS